jgi:CarboxypepD_reg-like domain
MKNQVIKTLFILFLSPLSITGLFAQKFTVSGTIRDAKTGEELIGASVVVKELAGIGVTCNEYGFYSLTLKSGTYTLKTSFVGYNDVLNTLKLDKDQKLDIKLSSGRELEVVTISAKKENENVAKAQMGVERLDIGEIAKIPVLFGEKDHSAITRRQIGG